ncbi:hypothetical protein [Streptomyces sp. EN23]|uniref:hypothetical protein n=1 Tax=Streptomyces sp. EN23 TaxID=212774 RepID=UPI00114D2C90|nr:hypothetical protein [Streptomyces sp. EN23]
MGATPPAARRGGAPAGLGVDWATITSSQPLPAPIGAVTFSHHRLSAAARCGALSVSAAGMAGGAGRTRRGCWGREESGGAFELPAAAPTAV